MKRELVLSILRVTTITPQKRAHVWEKDRIPFSDGDGNDEYFRNIQIADLNALNAALAVIKWKKLFGFYRDLEHDHFSTYTIDGNTLVNTARARRILQRIVESSDLERLLHRNALPYSEVHAPAPDAADLPQAGA